MLCVVCVPLSSLSRSTSPPARHSELTLLNTRLDVLRADCWCSSAALTCSARYRVESCHQLFLGGHTINGITSSGLAVSEVRKTESNCTNNNNDKQSQSCSVSVSGTLRHCVVRWTNQFSNYSVTLSPNYRPPRSPASPVLDACFLSFVRILGFGSSILPGSFASSRLIAISGRHRPRRVTFALHRARLLVWSVPPTPPCGCSQRLGLPGSLQHCCEVLCFGVVAGHVPVR